MQLEGNDGDQGCIIHSQVISANNFENLPPLTWVFFPGNGVLRLEECYYRRYKSLISK